MRVRRGSVDALPEDERKVLRLFVVGMHRTYAEAAEVMAQRGYPVSKSAVGRWFKRENQLGKGAKAD